MPSLSDHEASAYVKLILVGNSGSGKTGALTSLARAGYKLRIIDFDAGLDALVNHCREENLDLSSIQYNSFRDPVKMTASGPAVKGAPKAYATSLSALERWPDDESDPAAWGDDTILVIDSLTNAGRAAFQWARAQNPTTKDPRQWYKTAQDLIEDLIANVTSDSFRTHVIVISHMDVAETGEGLRKAFVSSIGKALGPKLPRFFNTVVLSETKGSGDKLRRMIRTVPTNLIDLKNPAPMKIKSEYGIEDGLAEIFKELRNG